MLYGVTLGSILGPLLFLLSFDDVGHVLSHCNIIMYADDTVISQQTFGGLQDVLNTSSA